MKFLVVGFGNIAKRHIRNLKSIDPSIQIRLWVQKGNSVPLGDLTPHVEKVHFSLEDALGWKSDAVILANPNHLHVSNGLMFAELGRHLFIEKPLSHTLEGVDGLLEMCQKKSLVLMTGYNFRFYEPFQKIKSVLSEGRIGRLISLRAEVGQYLPDWRSDRDYRTGVSARSELGGGAVLTLSHEIDYLRWFGGEVTGVMAQMGRLSDLEMDVEDTAEIFLQFSSGAIGHLHLDMVDRAENRRCRLVGTKGTVAWDVEDHRVSLFSGMTKMREDLYCEPHFDINMAYVAELQHFLACIKQRKQAMVDGLEGRRVLEIALAAKQSAQEGREIRL